jgi:hypothetical protein
MGPDMGTRRSMERAISVDRAIRAAAYLNRDRDVSSRPADACAPTTFECVEAHRHGRSACRPTKIGQRSQATENESWSVRNLQFADAAHSSKL